MGRIEVRGQLGERVLETLISKISRVKWGPEVWLTPQHPRKTKNAIQAQA
jgi:hypothetical protein